MYNILTETQIEKEKLIVYQIIKIIQKQKAIDEIKYELAQNPIFDSEIAYKSIDHEQCGYVKKKNLIEFCQHYQIDISQDEATYLLQKYANNDENLYFNNFLEIILPFDNTGLRTLCLSRKCEIMSPHLMQIIAKIFLLEIQHVRDLENSEEFDIMIQQGWSPSQVLQNHLKLPIHQQVDTINEIQLYEFMKKYQCQIPYQKSDYKFIMNSLQKRAKHIVKIGELDQLIYPHKAIFQKIKKLNQNEKQQSKVNWYSPRENDSQNYDKLKHQQMKNLTQSANISMNILEGKDKKNKDFHQKMRRIKKSDYSTSPHLRFLSRDYDTRDTERMMDDNKENYQNQQNQLQFKNQKKYSEEDVMSQDSALYSPHFEESKNLQGYKNYSNGKIKGHSPKSPSSNYRQFYQKDQISENSYDGYSQEQDEYQKVQVPRQLITNSNIIGNDKSRTSQFADKSRYSQNQPRYNYYNNQEHNQDYYGQPHTDISNYESVNINLVSNNTNNNQANFAATGGSDFAKTQTTTSQFQKTGGESQNFQGFTLGNRQQNQQQIVRQSDKSSNQ